MLFCVQDAFKNFEEVDESAAGIPSWEIMDMMQSSSFHRVMSRKEAEQKLENQSSDSNCYLTRYDAATMQYYLSVMTRHLKGGDASVPSFYHFVLNIAKKKSWQGNFAPEYELKGTQVKFDKVSDLLSAYKTSPINFQVDNIGKEVQSDYVCSEFCTCSGMSTYYNNVGDQWTLCNKNESRL